MIIKTPYNRELHEKQYEKNTLPSKTIPDQTLSIPELIKRYASGLPLEGHKQPIYSDNPEDDILGGRVFASLDLSEQYDIVRNAQQEYKQITQRLRNSKKQKNVSEDTTTQPEGENVG